MYIDVKIQEDYIITTPFASIGLSYKQCLKCLLRMSAGARRWWLGFCNKLKWQTTEHQVLTSCMLHSGSGYDFSYQRSTSCTWVWTSFKILQIHHQVLVKPWDVARYLVYPLACSLTSECVESQMFSAGLGWLGSVDKSARHSVTQPSQDE